MKGIGAVARIVRTWNCLVEPNKKIAGLEDQSGAKLFASLMIIHVAVVVVALIGINIVTVHYQDHRIWWDRDTWIVAGGAALIIVSYLVLRAGKYLPSVLMYIAITALVPLTGPFSGDPNADIGLLTIAITPTLLASYIFPLRWVASIFIFMFAAMTWQLTHTPLPPRIIGTGFAIMLGVMVCSGLIIVFRHRYRVIEKARMERIHENELALQRTTERLRVLLGNSMDILLGIDRNSMLIFIGGAFESTTGFRVEDRLGRPVYGLIHREDLDRVREELDGLKTAPGASIRSEWRQLHRDGRVQWYEALITNRLDQAGLENIVVNLREVTERRNAEELMRQSEAKYHNLFETVTDGIFVFDGNGRILEMNSGACRLTGFSREEMLGKYFPGKTMKNGVFDPINGTVSARNHGTNEAEIVRKDGTAIPIDLSVTSLFFEGSYAYLGLAHDASERKKVQAERKNMEDQIEQAARMETVGRLAGGIAHDFNNLLTIILGHAEILDDELSKGGQGNSHIKSIRSAGKNASLLVQHLLAFSRRELLTPEPLNINDRIASVFRMLMGLMGGNISVDFKPEDGIGLVYIDPGVLERTLINLAVNARDAMPGGGKLVIRTENAVIGSGTGNHPPGLVPGEYIMLAVADTGTGMTEAVKPHIFEPFFTTKPLGHGTGLGLATVYGAVRQAKGGIHVESEPGRGSVFTIYLPRVHGTPEPAETLAAPGIPANGTETILYAEDEDEVRDYTAKLLESHGYKVLPAPSGNSALELAEKHAGPIHMFFTDTIMPGLNGKQSAEKLSIIHPETRMLFTSGYSAEVLSMSKVMDGDIAFLHKPYSRQDLLARIRAILDAKPALTARD